MLKGAIEAYNRAGRCGICWSRTVLELHFEAPRRPCLNWSVRKARGTLGPRLEAFLEHCPGAPGGLAVPAVVGATLAAVRVPGFLAMSTAEWPRALEHFELFAA